MLEPINRMTALQSFKISSLNPTTNELVLESVYRREGCRGYWTHSKNPFAIKLKGKIELLNICDIHITGVSMDPV